MRVTIQDDSALAKLRARPEQAKQVLVHWSADLEVLTAANQRDRGSHERSMPAGGSGTSLLRRVDQQIC